MGERKACGRSMNLAEAVRELPYDEFIVRLIDAERDLEHRIIQRLTRLYRGNVEDEMKLAKEIANLESALNLAIKTRLQLEAARRVGPNTYRVVAELLQPSLARIDTALKEHPLLVEA